MSQLASQIKLFRYYKTLGEGAMAQMQESDLTQSIYEGDNSVAVIVGHLHGNMLSRWTGFPEQDGEKEWRQRDQEFEFQLTTKNEIDEAWEDGWTCLMRALEPLRDSDMNRITYIRQEGHTIAEAIGRQVAHYAYHVGQIVVLARYHVGEDWKSLSIPRGESATFNQKKMTGQKVIKHFTDH